MSLRQSVLLSTIVLLLCAIAFADKVVLKDGTVLEGTVIKQQDGYWYKSPDGEHRHIDNVEIDHVEKGDAPSAPNSPKSGSGAEEAPKPHLTGSLLTVKRRLAEMDSPVGAVALLRQYIASNPPADDLKAAQEELAKWKKLEDEGAEKIKGRWVGGDERKAILAKAATLQKDGLELMRKKQTLQAVSKLEEAQVVYPNSFDSAFWLGYIMMVEHDAAKATKYFGQAQKLDPNSSEVMANLALLQLDKHQTSDAVMGLYKAAQKQDNREIAQDLVTTLSLLTPTQRNSDRMKPVIDAANLLSSQYSVKGPGPLIIVPLHHKQDGPEPGAASSGTGFFILSEGLILTNRHVVNQAKTLTVLIDGKGEKPGEIINIDDEDDLALVKVEMDGAMPALRLSSEDEPPQGAECAAMGFPLADRFGPGIKLTRGIVSSNNSQHVGGDVMVDAKINPGNSGGPILDKYGNVMAIVVAKSVNVTGDEDSYGFGISAGKIRKFLAKSHVNVPAAEKNAGALDTEQIAAKAKPAVVCILATY